MTDLADLGFRFDDEGVVQAERAFAGVAAGANDVQRATTRAERATDSLGDSARYASSASGLLTKSMMEQQRVVLAARSAMGLTASEGLNMSRQFADIGVSAAMGMNPLMIAIQQGPQLMDIFQQAVIRTGRSIKTVMLEAGAAIWTAMAPILPIIAAVGAAVGAVAGSWALATRSMRNDIGNLTDGMGLTEKQMKRLEDAGVSTSITAGDAFRGLGTTIKEVLVENFGTQIDWMAGAWSKTMDFMTEYGSIAVAGIGAAFVGTYRAIINTWQRAPAALGDIAIRTVNAMASGLDWIVQKSVDGINALVVAAKALSLVNPSFAWARGLGPVSAPRIGGMDNPYQGSAAALGQTNAAGYADAYRDVRGALAGGMDRWRENTAASGHARVLDAAGDAERTRAAAAGRSGRSGSGSATADAVREIDNQPLRDQLTLLRLQGTLFGASEAARAEAMAMEAKRLELQSQGFTDQNEGYAEAVRLAGGLARMQVENGQALEAYNLGLEYHLDLLRQVDDHARAAARGLSEAFGAPGRALGDLLSGLTSVQVRLAEIDKAERQYRQSVMKTGVDQRQLAMFARDRAQAEVQSYGDMVSAAKGFFREGSDGYQALQAAEQAYRAIQFAMSIQAMAMGGQETAFTVGQNAIRAVSHGVVAVARALASLPFPFNLAAGAATVAALAAIGVRLSGGGGGGGGKGSGSSVAGSVETVQSQVSQQQSSGQNFVQSLAQHVKVSVEFDDPMFRARVQKETVPIVQAGAQASVAASRQIIPAEQGRRVRMTYGGR